MKKIKSLLRLISIGVLIVLAMCGVGFLGALFPNERERMDKRVTTERKEEGAADQSQE